MMAWVWEVTIAYTIMNLPLKLRNPAGSRNTIFLPLLVSAVALLNQPVALAQETPKPAATPTAADAHDGISLLPGGQWHVHDVKQP